MELNNLVCYILVTLLYLDIQTGKEAMKVLEYQQGIRGGSYCMKIIMKD